MSLSKKIAEMRLEETDNALAKHPRDLDYWFNRLYNLERKREKKRHNEKEGYALKESVDPGKKEKKNEKKKVED